MRLDVVIPAHNEQHRIDRTLRAYRETCDNDTRFLVALDNCTDGTEGVVNRHVAVDPRVHVVGYPKLGKGGVIMETFRRCDADLLAFVDADCATPPAELLRLAAAAEGADGAIASRRHPASLTPGRRRFGRRLSSAMFVGLVRSLFRLPFTDTQCGAKVMQREAVQKVLPFLSSRDLLFDVDLLFVARRLGLRVVEVPTIWIDRDGSKVNTTSDARRMAFSALRLWLHHKVMPVEHRGEGEAQRVHGPSAEQEAVQELVPRAGRPPPSKSPAEERPSAPAAVPARPGRAAFGAPPADVAIVSLYPPPGSTHAGHSGVASYTANLARALSDAGAKVAVVAPAIEGAPESVFDGRVRVERKFSKGRRAYRSAATAALGTGARVVHVQHELFLFGGPSAIPGLLPALVRLRSSGRGPVVTMHQVVDPATVDEDFVRMHRTSVPASLARLGIAELQHAVRRSARTVVVHEPAFARVIPGAVVVPHGVERRRRLDRRFARRRLGLDLERPVVLCFGFVAPYKGLEAALEAADLCSGAIQLVIAGGTHPRFQRDPYVAGLRARWPHAARFTGHVHDEDVDAVFSAADACLFAYPKPFASSGALALALAYGIPVMVSRALGECIGAPEELIVPTDPVLLAKRFGSLLFEPERLTRMGPATRSLLSGRSWPEVADRHLRIYAEVSDDQAASRGRLRAG